MTSRDKRSIRSMKIWVLVASASVFLIGFAALLGWMLDISFLKSLVPSIATMKANTAICFMLVGIALWLLNGDDVRRRRVAQIGALMVLLIGLLTLSEYILGWDLHIDQQLFKDSRSIGFLVAGRMSPATAFNFCILALSIWLLSTSQWDLLIQIGALSVAVIALLAVASYLYGVVNLPGAFDSMAPNTTLAFLLSSIGILLVRPDRGLMTTITSDSPGAIMARRLLPAIVLVPLVLGWFRLKGQQQGFYGTEFGLALFAVSNIITFVTLVWWNAHVISSADAERRQAEARVRKLNRVYAVLSDINQAVVRIRQRQKLFEKSCEIAIEKGEFRMAWIGLVDPKTQQLTIVADAGVVEDYLEKLTLDLNDNLRPSGPASDSVRTATHVICNDIEHDPRMAYSRNAALQLDYRSLAVFPLIIAGTVCGVLNLYASEQNFFDDEEIKLLDEMALDIAFAMEFSEQENQRRQAQAAMLESESRYHRILDSLSEGAQIIGFDWRYLYINDATARHGHSSKEALLGYTMMEKYPGIERTEVFAALQRCMEDRTAQHMDNEFIYPDGAKTWFELSIQPVLEGIFILSLDITERKQVEVKLQRYAQRLEILHEIDNGIIEARSIQEMIETVLKHVRQLIPCNRASVFLQDSTKNEAVIFAIDLNNPSVLGQGARVPLPPEWVKGYESDSIMVFDDIRLATKLILPYEQLIQEGLLSSCHVLLKAQGQLSGSLNLLSDTLGFFNAEYREITIEIASQLAIAIHQLRLSEAAASHAAELEQRVDERTVELSRAKDRVEAILNNSTDGILLVNPDLSIQQNNPAFDALFANSPDEYSGKSLMGLVHREDMDQVTKTIQTVLAEQQGHSVEIRMVRHDNTPFDTELSLGFIGQTNYQDAGLVCTIRDITERKEHERQLRYHASLQENVTDAVIATDLDFRIQSWNPAAERIYDWTAQEVLGKPLGDILRTEFPSGETQEQTRRDFLEQGYWTAEVIQHDKHDKAIHILSSVVLFKDQKKHPFGVVAVNHDITQRKQTELALQAKIAEEREFQKYLAALHEMTIELTQIDQLDDFYKRVVELGRERLGFDRFALLLYDTEDGIALGTYGTDAQGKLTDEHHVRFDPASLTGILMRALNQAERFSLDEQTQLYDNREFISMGWNAAAVLWDGVHSLGWLAADNAIRHQPASKPILDILALYSLAVGTLLARKTAQIALHESEVRSRLMIEGVKDYAIYLLDQSGHVLTWNPGAKNLKGYSEQEIVGQSFAQFFSVEDQKQGIPQHLLDLAETEGRVETEGWRFRKDGARFWANAVITALRNTDGSLYGFAKVTRDLTQRRLAEQTLRQQHDFLQQVIDNVPSLIIVKDRDGRFQLANALAAQIYSITPTEMIGKTDTDINPNLDEIAFFREKDREVLETKQFVFIPEELILDRYYQTNKIPLKNSDGEFDRLLIVASDITERKRAEAAIREREALYRLLAENVSDLISRIDATGVYTYVAPSSQRILGYEPEELIGKSGFEGVHPDDAPELTRRQMLALDPNGPSTPTTYRLRHKDGRYIWMESTGQIIWSENKQEFLGFVMVSRDITERKRSEETLQKAFEKEKELNELKSRFVSMASHEFRTPLATMLAIAESLSAYRGRMDEAQIEKRLGKIQEQGGHLKDIMEDVLQLARIQARRVEFNPIVLDLDSLCRSVIDEFQSRPDIIHQIIYSCDPALHKVKLDKKLMRQIISNLVTNAIKYSPKDKPVAISLDYADETLKLRVRDEGIGIPAPDLKHLFEPFHRAANVGTISGTGLGLTIIKESVELHGGTITVDSTVEVGTTFTVSIPVTVKGE